jgi:sulfur-oxidizing protein SoxA
MRARRRSSLRNARSAAGFLTVAAAAAAATALGATDGSAPARWVSRVIPEAGGEVTTGPDGRPIQIRYEGWDGSDFSQFPTYSYADSRSSPAVQIVPRSTDVNGDAARGEEIWKRSACINCHVVPNDGRWAGNVGPSLAGYGDGVDPLQTYQVIYDPRGVVADSIMPPWGTSGLLSAQDVADVTAYVHAEKTPAQSGDLREEPASRPLPQPYFGDNLDSGSNPAVLLGEQAEAAWRRAGATGRSCGNCHGDDVAAAMKGVAVRYPRFSPRYGRVVSIEDFLSAHAFEETGTVMPVAGDENLHMTVLIKMASNGLPISLELQDPNLHAALARGKDVFHRRVGQRNHACADCHSEATVGNKWLGGRYLGRATIEAGLTASYPTWRTSFEELWSIRKRMQWCMLPHGTNNLSADAVEYAELELYLASFENGKPMSVPGLKD